MSEPVRIGTKVAPYGVVSAVGWIDGERYYWLTDGQRVAMMPAMVVESPDSKEAV